MQQAMQHCAIALFQQTNTLMQPVRQLFVITHFQLHQQLFHTLAQRAQLLLIGRCRRGNRQLADRKSGV